MFLGLFPVGCGRRVGPSRLVPGLARESSRHGRLLHGPSDDLCGRPSRMPCRAIWPTCQDAGRRPPRRGPSPWSAPSRPAGIMSSRRALPFGRDASTFPVRVACRVCCYVACCGCGGIRRMSPQRNDGPLVQLVDQFLDVVAAVGVHDLLVGGVALILGAGDDDVVVRLGLLVDRLDVDASDLGLSPASRAMNTLMTLAPTSGSERAVCEASSSVIFRFFGLDTMSSGVGFVPSL